MKWPKRVWLVRFYEPNDPDLYLWHRAPPVGGNEPMGPHYIQEYILAPKPTRPRKAKKKGKGR